VTEIKEKISCPEIHKWTHKGKRVLIVKCVDKDGKGHGGFQYPKSGKVHPGKCSMEPTCDSGGLFGWAWGLNIGGGKEPDYRGCWIVLAADPDLVVEVESEKCKVAGEAEVVFYGQWMDAIAFTLEGRLAWIAEKTKDADDKSTGDSGSASSTGVRGSASSTGVRGSASSTGEKSIAALTGECGKIEAGKTSIAAVTATEFTWIFCKGSILVCRWEGGHKLFVADEMNFKDGDEVKIINGEIVS
jgi:hypothetical protein